MDCVLDVALDAIPKDHIFGKGNRQRAAKRTGGEVQVQGLHVVPLEAAWLDSVYDALLQFPPEDNLCPLSGSVHA
jgi:hypothetical protein